MTGSRIALDPDEEAIARARIRARALAARLAVSLVDRELYTEIRLFLDEVGFPACDAMEAFASRTEVQLRRRLHLVLGLGASIEDET
ncbi:hypothetical protein SAMN05421504_112203 [Amycolatopsis xylanica]|uniref:Uncharacterized protein n=1 Tax=Amycolatopsis xylanica TaxID=589385 RepID=A0A1H3S4K6_9PSEU|nr:hypothetical protein SAMN05421504_112203 [Amycolatopsis xylanica]